MPIEPLFPKQTTPSRELLHDWAPRYAYQGDTEVEAIGRRAGTRGYFTNDEYRTVCYWKSPRSQSLVAKNATGEIEEVTRLALAVESERLRIGALTVLSGVAWPTASVILHLAHREPYPVLDVRALEALGIPQPSDYNFQFWWGYVVRCRSVAQGVGVSMRTLDRALWQYSKEQGA